MPNKPEIIQFVNIFDVCIKYIHILCIKYIQEYISRTPLNSQYRKKKNFQLYIFLINIKYNCSYNMIVFLRFFIFPCKVLCFFDFWVKNSRGFNVKGPTRKSIAENEEDGREKAGEYKKDERKNQDNDKKEKQRSSRGKEQVWT